MLGLMLNTQYRQPMAPTTQLGESIVHRAHPHRMTPTSTTNMGDGESPDRDNTAVDNGASDAAQPAEVKTPASGGFSGSAASMCVIRHRYSSTYCVGRSLAGDRVRPLASTRRATCRLVSTIHKAARDVDGAAGEGVGRRQARERMLE